MKKIIHRASSRGHANHGWLDTHHTFSFADYYDPERIHFGALRVLNDDSVAPGMGFGTHPHENMEIISIPLEGDLEHRDSMGNVAIIREGDIQVMTAGTGVMHSEKNHHTDREVKFLQIWIFPRQRGLQPRYDQMSIRDVERKNSIFQILSPSQDDQGVWIYQDSWFSLGDFEEGHSESYELKKKNNGLYLFVLDGEVEAEGEILHKRDGMGIWDANAIGINSHSDSRILLMEVPMLE